MWISILVRNFVPYHGAERVAHTVFVCASTVAMLVLARRWARRACLSVEAGTLRYRGLLRTRTAPAGTATRVVVVSVEGPGTRRLYRRWLLLDGHDEAQLALDTTTWSEDDLRHVAEVLGIAPETDAMPRSSRELRRQYPRSVPWLYAHPCAFTFILIGVGTVALLVAQAMTGVDVG